MEASVIEKFVEDLDTAFKAGDPRAATKASETSCVEALQGMYRAAVRGDIAAFLGALAEDVEMENVGPESIPFVGRWNGREAVAAAVARNFAWLEDQRPEVLTVVAQGDTVVVHGHERGRFKPTGRPYAMHWVQLFTMRDGCLVRFRQVFDSAQMVDAVAEWKPQ
ncbi:SnoaL-like domain protein [Gemmata sp. SH-PL17]|uniref:nuclear transport factor 2 family protein n=1 Tax=Gemmata sp. SH-PL17 TaxID=1630693 RepID=UPI00078C71FE|nr:nuclear transport factor 2 family protein [Gemmata sp. SH-PL17]AMV28001.1 SnoaL-like domain protein [Gemmata sp. SH-PL17]